MKLFDQLPNLEVYSLLDRPTAEILEKLKQLKLENIETDIGAKSNHFRKLNLRVSER
jgi:hypothetical protein